jgi:hypothetical protein
MPGATNLNFWHPKLVQKFQKAVQELSSLTENPCPEGKFDLPAENGTGYILRLKDELLLATHIAVLAHSEEGVFAISSVAIEEQLNGLIFRLASNEKPKQEVVSRLQSLLDWIAQSSVEGWQRLWMANDVTFPNGADR